jgi:hypothetical protein
MLLRRVIMTGSSGYVIDGIGMKLAWANQNNRAEKDTGISTGGYRIALIRSLERVH